MGIFILGISATTNLNLIKVQVFPKVPKPRFVIDIQTEPGTDLEKTNSITLELEHLLAQTVEVSRFASTVGESGVQNIRINQKWIMIIHFRRPLPVLPLVLLSY